MKRTIALLALVLLLASVAPAQSARRLDEPGKPDVRWLVAAEATWLSASAFDVHHTRAGIAAGAIVEGNPVLATERLELRTGRAWAITGAVATGAALLWRRYPRWANGILFVGGAVRAVAGAVAANERYRRTRD